MGKEKKLIYIAGPLTTGSELENFKKATKVGLKARDLGFTPIVPHNAIFVDLVERRDYEFWMEWDFDLLLHCKALLRVEGPSSGADREVKFAMNHKIPVYYTLDDLVKGEL